MLDEMRRRKGGNSNCLFAPPSSAEIEIKPKSDFQPKPLVFDQTNDHHTIAAANKLKSNLNNVYGRLHELSSYINHI